MPGTTVAAGVPHCWQLPLGPHPLDLSSYTVNIVDHTAAKLSWLEALRASSLSPGSPDHSSQPALAATPQAPPPTFQAPIPKPVPRPGLKRTLQMFMDHFLKPNTTAIDDTGNDAIVVLTGDPELLQFFQQKNCATKIFPTKKKRFQPNKLSNKKHLEERLLDQAQVRASYVVYPPLFGGHSRSIPQGMMFDLQPLVKSFFCPIRQSPNGFFDSEASIP